MQNKRLRLIAFYLPQFHPIPENNAWWEPGFTEWFNVTRAKPLFKGHYQPKLPADLGFYDLRVPETRIAQAEMAQQYGIEGFCYWHYWFGGGQRILERPFHEVLTSKEPNFPFCLGWANESWTGIWHGAADRVLAKQTYPGKADYEAHFEYLVQAFADERYMTVDGKPLFFVFQPLNLPDMQEFTDTFRGLAYQAGLKGLYLVANQNVYENWNPTHYGFDAMNCSNHALIMFSDPDNYRDRLSWSALNMPGMSRIRKKLNGLPIQKYVWHQLQKPDISARYKQWLQRPIHIYEYKDAMRYFVFRNNFDFEYYPCIIPGWDNTPRSRSNGLILHNTTPEFFREHVKEAVDRVKQLPADHKIIFIKSWNEWAEGNYLEPDQRYGYAFLEVLKEEIEAFQRGLNQLPA